MDLIILTIVFCIGIVSLGYLIESIKKEAKSWHGEEEDGTSEGAEYLEEEGVGVDDLTTIIGDG